MTGDDWEPVTGYEGLYEINLAAELVRSIDRTVDGLRGPRRLMGVTLVQVPDRSGCPQVTLSRGGKRRVFRVERLIAQAREGVEP